MKYTPLDSLKYAVGEATDFLKATVIALEEGAQTARNTNPAAVAAALESYVRTIDALERELAAWCPNAADRERYSDGRPCRTYVREPGIEFYHHWPADPDAEVREPTLQTFGDLAVEITFEKPSTVRLKVVRPWTP